MGGRWVAGWLCALMACTTAVEAPAPPPAAKTAPAAASAKVVPTIPRGHPPRVLIMSPQPPALFFGREEIFFKAYVYDDEDSLVRSDGVRWSSDLDGAICRGYCSKSAARLSEGVHDIVAMDEDKDGNTAVAHVKIEVQRFDTRPLQGPSLAIRDSSRSPEHAGRAERFAFEVMSVGTETTSKPVEVLVRMSPGFEHARAHGKNWTCAPPDPMYQRTRITCTFAQNIPVGYQTESLIVEAVTPKNLNVPRSAYVEADASFAEPKPVGMGIGRGRFEIMED